MVKPREYVVNPNAANSLALKHDVDDVVAAATSMVVVSGVTDGNITNIVNVNMMATAIL
jgi:hypothetical protein